MTRIGYVRMHGRGLRLSEAFGLRSSLPARPPQRVTSSPSSADAAEAVLPSVAAGDEGAAERCFDRYSGLIWSLARKYFAKRSDAEDAVQEAFVAIWQNADRFDPAVASETTYVAMIARRRMIDLIRRSKAARRTLNPDEASGLGAPPAVEELAAAGPTTIQADGVGLQGFEIAEEAERVRVQMAALSEDQQRVLRLALVEGQSQAQIAESTGWPLGTVKSHARRGMKRLRELLSQESNTPRQEANR